MRFRKKRRKGKRNLPLIDRFVKPSKSASWFIRIFEGSTFLIKRPPSTSIHTRTNNERSCSMLVQVRLLKTKLGFFFSFSLFWLFLSDKETNLYYYIFKTILNNNNLNSNPYQIRKRIYIIIYLKLFKKPFTDYFLIQ